MADKSSIKKSKNNYRRKSILSVVFLLIGVFVLCIFLALMQNYSAERNQKNSSMRILDEVELTLQNNDEIVTSVFYEYNEINQTTISTLEQYIDYIDIMSPLRQAASLSHDDLSGMIASTAKDLKKICKTVNIDDMFVFDETGLIVLSSNLDYLNQNLSTTLSKDQFKNLVGYSTEGEIRNGTYSVVDGKAQYDPVVISYDGVHVYLYSTYFTREAGKDYYLLTYVPDTIITHELSGIKSIESVLSGVTVGKSGFLFAIDTNEGVFSYFDDGVNNLSGLSYGEYGLKDEAATGNYSGYQTIDGTSYYCVTKDFKSSTYGEFTIIAAVVSQDEILAKNVLTIAFSCIAFTLVAAIIASYGFILRRDIVNHILHLEDRFRINLKEDDNSNYKHFTEEEIDERTKILIDDEIAKGKDKKLKRKNIGVRNAKGKQSYFSTYMFGKMSSVIIIGLVLIFGVSFFSQTLLGLNDATSVSTKRLEEIVQTINKNEGNTETINSYVDMQFLSKARLISHLLEETPEIMFLNEDEESYHRIFEKDEKGNNVYLTYTDYPSVPRLAVSNSQALQLFCDNNGIKSLYVFTDDGRVLATNTDLWYFEISKDPTSQSYPFNDILDDKIKDYTQSTMEGDATGSFDKYIGTQFFYYTYLDGDEVVFAPKSAYEAYQEGTWTKAPITKHRSLIQIGVSEESIRGLFETSSISYVLSNMHVYGEESFFIAFDRSDEHRVIYAPYEGMIGQSAHAIGISESAFMPNGVYNGFQSIHGQEYYQSVELLGDYFIATAIPTSSIYSTRNAIALYTLLFSAISIIAASSLFTISSDRADKDYCNSLKYATREEVNPLVLTMPSGKKKKTKAVAARFSRIAWEKKSPEEKLSAILMSYMTLASVIIVIVLIVALNSRGDDSIFSYIFSDMWERGFNIFAFTESLMLMIILITVTKLAQVCVRSFCGTLGARVETTGNLVVSVLRYGGVIGGTFYCLYLFGFDTTSLLTSAGILSLVIGLGAQSLISDVIAGIFIVFEGAFRVGDIVTIGDFRGQVLEIGLRTTKIEDIEKNIKIFNNSAISGVLNMTKEASYASLDLSIEYGESIERVEKVLKEAFPKIKRKLPEITDGPFYHGVQELGDSAVIIRVKAQCEEKDRLQLSRDLNRELYILFQKNNINIPFPQVTVSQLAQKEEIKEETKEDEE